MSTPESAIAPPPPTSSEQAYKLVQPVQPPRGLREQLQGARQRRTLTLTERILLGLAVFLVFAFVLTYALGGSGVAGYIFVRIWSDGSAFLRDHVLDGGLAILCLYAGAQIRGIGTVEIPLASNNDAPPTLHLVRYKSGSMTLNGDRYLWREKDGTIASCNRRWMAQTGKWGGWKITQEVERTLTGSGTATYETRNVEATRSEAMAGRMRLMANEIARLRDEKVRGA